MGNTISHPDHYTKDKKIEPINVIEDWGLGVCLGNVIKYVSRAGKKDPTKEIEDLEKARFYLDRYIRTLKKQKGE